MTTATHAGAILGTPARNRHSVGATTTAQWADRVIAAVEYGASATIADAIAEYVPTHLHAAVAHDCQRRAAR